MVKFFLIQLLIAFTICYAQKQTIIQAEYFKGNDPGEGNGTQLTLSQFGNPTVDITSQTTGIPDVKQGECFYIRIKSSGLTDNKGKQIPGVWSIPMLMCFPSPGLKGYPLAPTNNAIIKSVEAKLVRPGLEKPVLISAWATDGKFDSVIDSIRTIILGDSLQIGDTVLFRLQGYCDLWGDWSSILIRELPEAILSLSGNLNFGDVQINDTKELTLQITNKGNIDLVVDSISFPQGFSSRGMTFPKKITPNQNQQVQVTFEPIDKKIYIGKLKVYSNAKSGTSLYSVLGNGIASGIFDDNFSINFLFISPNPASDNISISFSYSGKSITIFNSLGIELKKLNENELSGLNSIIISTMEYPSGIYYCTLRASNYTETKKFVVIR